MTKAAARQVYEAAGIGPEDVDVVELHDCFAQNELISYEALGLCPEGGGEKFVADGDNTYGGRYVTNPSGGLLSKGHPLGATGLAQCYELTHQLRGTAGARQVDGARDRAAAQSRARRRLRRHAVPRRLRRIVTEMIDRHPHRPGDSVALRRRGGGAPAPVRQGDRRDARRIPRRARRTRRRPSVRCRRRRRSCFASTSRCPTLSRGSPDMGIDIAAGAARRRAIPLLRAGVRRRPADVFVAHRRHPAEEEQQEGVRGEGDRSDQPARRARSPRCARRSSCAKSHDACRCRRAYDAVSVGDVLPPLSLPPVTRATLALYAGASGDHNPIHIDVDFARAAGMPDVFAHGMLRDGVARAPADRLGAAARPARVRRAVHAP